MTENDLKKFGIYRCNRRKLINFNKDSNLFFIPYVGDVVLTEPYTFEHILKLIYEKRKSRGIEIGKQQKIDEIKFVLKIDENNE